MERKICRLMEAFHQVLILQLICPFLYAFYDRRQDRWIFPLYLTGWALIICALATRKAARQTRTLWGYLAAAVAGTAGSMLVSGLLVSLRFLWPGGGTWLHWSAVQWAALIACPVLCLWMTVEAAMIRMNGKRRKQAMENNDISWTEHQTLLQRPAGPYLIWFAIVYTAALLCNCPRLCDLSLAGGILYLMAWLAWRQCTVTDDYLEETRALSNVPVNKIRRMHRGMILAALAVLIPVAAVSFLTGSLRQYKDLRKADLSMPLAMEPADENYMPMAEEGFADWMEFIDQGEPAFTWPAWVEKLPTVIFILMMIAVGFLALRAAREYLLEFAGVPEENGDLSQSLEEETSEKLRPFRGRFSFGGMTEKEKVRRQYRRAIRRYRKEKPGIYESPEEIEAGAAFPPGFDSVALHEAYEQARYGR